MHRPENRQVPSKDGRIPALCLTHLTVCRFTPHASRPVIRLDPLAGNLLERLDVGLSAKYPSILHYEKFSPSPAPCLALSRPTVHFDRLRLVGSGALEPEFYRDLSGPENPGQRGKPARMGRKPHWRNRKGSGPLADRSGTKPQAAKRAGECPRGVMARPAEAQPEQFHGQVRGPP